MKTMKRIIMMMFTFLIIMFTFVNCEKNDDNTCLYKIDIYQQDIITNPEGDTVSCSDIYISYKYDTTSLYSITLNYDELKKYYINKVKSIEKETETEHHNLWFVLSDIDCH